MRLPLQNDTPRAHRLRRPRREQSPRARQRSGRDSELFDHLRSKRLSAEIYAFPCTSFTSPFPSFFEIPVSPLTRVRRVAVMTLCACTPPLDQVLQLWDFLLAFGVHLNVLCVIAQLLLIRDDLMTSKR